MQQLTALSIPGKPSSYILSKYENVFLLFSHKSLRNRCNVDRFLFSEQDIGILLLSALAGFWFHMSKSQYIVLSFRSTCSLVSWSRFVLKIHEGILWTTIICYFTFPSENCFWIAWKKFTNFSFAYNHL